MIREERRSQVGGSSNRKREEKARGMSEAEIEKKKN